MMLIKKSSDGNCKNNDSTTVNGNNEYDNYIVNDINGNDTDDNND